MTVPLKVLPGASASPEELKRRIAKLKAEREALQELLAQQQRVAQVGLITSGLAHDVDNHVQIITGAAFLAQQSQSPDDWKRALEKVTERCCALTETTRAFLGFVRRRDAVGQTSFLAGEALEETVRLCQPLARRGGVQLTAISDAAAEVVGARRLAVQALVNLVTNAVKACPATTGRVDLSASRPSPKVCRIEVRDNGGGIPPEVRRRLFRPFASGNPQEGGNGLGLFIVRQTIRRMGGSIRMETSPEGTVFRLDLPCRD